MCRFSGVGGGGAESYFHASLNVLSLLQQNRAKISVTIYMCVTVLVL